MAAILITPSGEMRTLIPPVENQRFTMFELGFQVGACFGILDLPENFAMFYNRDGDDMCLPYNETAANILVKAFKRPELVYGVVIVLPKEEISFPGDRDWRDYKVRILKT